MGGLMRVHSGRGRQYGLMLILALGAAILGVMAIHKLREKRVLSLLVEEKDRELFSLQLLLQKEREEKKEAERKTEETIEKLYSLRTVKKELDSKISELLATISSLQDEQRTIGSALEEKQNEIKMLREKVSETDKENAQVVALRETLKQKEDEIQNMENRLQYSKNQVLPVSTDDPSKQTEGHEGSTVKQESVDEGTKVSGENLNESTTSQEGDNSRSGEGRGEEVRGLSDANEITAGSSQNTANEVHGEKSSDTAEITEDHSQSETDEVKGQKVLDQNEVTGEQSEGGSNELQGERVKDLQENGLQEDKTNAKKIETMDDQGRVLITQGESNDKETTEGKANGVGDVAEVENVSSQGDTNQMSATDEKKLEKPDDSEEGAGQGGTARHGRYKELRDAALQKLDASENNRDSELKVQNESDQKSENTEVDGNHQQGESMEVKNEDGVRSEGGEANNSGKDDVFADVSGKGGNNDPDQQTDRVQERDYENFEKPNANAADAHEQKSDEVQKGGDDRTVQQKTETRYGDKADQNSGEAKALEVAQTQGAKTESRDEAEGDNESEDDPDDL